MAKYSEKAGEKVEKTMHEMKAGKLKSGSGKKVTSKKVSGGYRVIRKRVKKERKCLRRNNFIKSMCSRSGPVDSICSPETHTSSTGFRVTPHYVRCTENASIISINGIASSIEQGLLACVPLK